MYKIIREVLFFLLSLLSLILFVQSLSMHEDRAVNPTLDRELRQQKENHLEGRRKLNKEEEADYKEKSQVNEKAKKEEQPQPDEKSNSRLSPDDKKNFENEDGPVELIIKAEDGSLIDLNQATAEELTKLKGIGPKLAEKIIVYRKENGVFISLDDLLNVKGIGAKKLNQIKTKGLQ